MIQLSACDLTLSSLNYQLAMERGCEEASEWGSSIEFDVLEESSGCEDQVEKGKVNLDLTISSINCS